MCSPHHEFLLLVMFPFLTIQKWSVQHVQLGIRRWSKYCLATYTRICIQTFYRNNHDLTRFAYFDFVQSQRITVKRIVRFVPSIMQIFGTSLDCLCLHLSKTALHRLFMLITGVCVYRKYIWIDKKSLFCRVLRVRGKLVARLLMRRMMMVNEKWLNDNACLTFNSPCWTQRAIQIIIESGWVYVPLCNCHCCCRWRTAVQRAQLIAIMRPNKLFNF